jgi:hypothetical protein
MEGHDSVDVDSIPPVLQAAFLLRHILSGGGLWLT